MRICTLPIVSRSITVLLLATYAYLALKPFHWDPPERVTNGASLLEGEMIRLPEPGIVRTPAPPEWLPTVVQESRIAVRLGVRTSSRQQWGPARIFTISANPNLRNLTIAQAGDKLVIRLRTTVTSVDGQPELRFPGVFTEPRWRLIELDLRPGSLAVAVDQLPLLDAELPDAPLQSWDPSFRLALGNELTGDRPWLGEISEATILVGDRPYNCLEKRALELPYQYWSGVKLHPYYSIVYLTRAKGLLRDAILNLVGFVPFGFIAALFALHPRRVSYAVALGCLASLSVEAAQVGFSPRNPSVVDWVLNTVGAALGAILADRFVTIAREMGKTRTLTGGAI